MLSRISKMLHTKSSLKPSGSSYIYQLGKPVWSNRRYEEFAKAYTENVIVHRAIKMIANTAASIPIKLYQSSNKGDILLHTHPILELLKNPNSEQNGTDFLESLYTYRLISGNAFILGKQGDDQYMNFQTLELLCPSVINVLAGKDGKRAGYRHTIGNSYSDYAISEDGMSDILHIKSFNPLSNWYGLSSIESIAISVDQHNQASIWNQSLLQNGARPSAVLTLQNYVNQEEFERLQESIRNAFTSPDNAGRLLLLEGGLELKSLGFSPQDMDFLESKMCSAREIAIGLGVPPQLLGLPGENKYNNFEQARISFLEQTVIPLVQHTVHHLNKWLIRKTSNFQLKHDATLLSAMADRVHSTWERLEKATFITVNEKRAMLGLEPIAEQEKNKDTKSEC
ncbi:phage portal protein [Candidatus Fokinia crypta]|uniref:HK97 family phage portal protein n=1 Tax=Candidatus Fokinia crypta TaxID=1920990 RepID=A0ABZ0UQ94_9RICK|nr:phage portal protein [Candidatus Fokinia cryptica]WPX97727.1 Putative HK97 family phage portal protein [Candidatus Fokinia cryptica]